MDNDILNAHLDQVLPVSLDFLCQPWWLHRGPTGFRALLHSLYLGSIPRKHDILFHCYADDSQLYLPLKKADSSLIKPLLNSLDGIKATMALNFLNFNDKRTIVPWPTTHPADISDQLTSSSWGFSKLGWSSEGTEPFLLQLQNCGMNCTWDRPPHCLILKLVTYFLRLLTPCGLLILCAQTFYLGWIVCTCIMFLSLVLYIFMFYMFYNWHHTQHTCVIYILLSVVSNVSKLWFGDKWTTQRVLKIKYSNNIVL